MAGEVLARAYEVRDETARALVPLRTEPVGWRRKLADWFALRGPGMQLAFAGASLLLLVCGSWFMFRTIQLQNRVGALEAERQRSQQEATSQRRRQDELRQELAKERERRAELERQGSKGPAAPGFLSFVLAPGLV